METIVLGIVLFVNVCGFIWLRASLARGFNQVETVVTNKTRSVKASVSSKIEKAVQPKVDVTAFVEHTIQAFEQQEEIETHSSVEADIIRYLAQKYVQYSAANCSVQESPRYVYNDNQGLDLISTYFSIR